MSTGTAQAREARLGNGKWTSVDALDRPCGGAPGNKVKKEVRTPGPKEYLGLQQYGALLEVFRNINLVVMSGMDQGSG